jgi:hypothetical protein
LEFIALIRNGASLTAPEVSINGGSFGAGLMQLFD